MLSLMKLKKNYKMNMVRIENDITTCVQRDILDIINQHILFELN